jgi:hypothetical protein
MPNFVSVQKLVFVLERGDAAGTTEFDNIDVQTIPEASVLDTLMSIRVPPNEFPTMTVYRGHDFAKPFIYTGFAPWDFQRQQCQDLFDFVLQKLWGIYPKSAALAAMRSVPMFAPAHSFTMPTRGLRSGFGATGSGTGLRSTGTGTGLRQTNPLGARPRRNGNP